MNGSGDRMSGPQQVLNWTLQGPHSLPEQEGKTEVEVIDTKDPAVFLGRQDETHTALMMLRDAIYEMCELHKVYFKNLEKLQKRKCAKSIR